MKGDLTLAILELVQFSASLAGDILDAITYHGYNASYKRLRGIPTIAPQRKPILQKKISQIQERQRISKLLYKLKSEGLIKERLRDGERILEITDRGEKKIHLLRASRDAKPRYDTHPSNDLKIIIFDVPESERVKRFWLREALRNLNFKMLQKSVWAGKVVVPEDFFDDLRARSLLPFVEIFAVTKSGTLKQLK